VRILDPHLHLGTSSWSSRDWEGVFYPEGAAPGEYLSHYSTRFRTVEVDATFYNTPSAATVAKWRTLLPEGFLMAAKVPRVVTHDKVLVDCGAELSAFVSVMEQLGDRLGPLLLQFPYFNKASGMTAALFLERLAAFLPSLPRGLRFALEIRNKTWLAPPLVDALREYGVALALIDHPWMPRIDRLPEAIDPVTAGFSYVRWLGDRRGIEERTKRWDRLIQDRTAEMRAWVPTVRHLLGRRIEVFGYFNNHYAGHAPGSIELFERVWDETAPSREG